MRGSCALILFLTGLCFVGCATAVHGTRERVAVTSEPSGARVTVEPGGSVLTTPAKVELERSAAYVLTFQLDGFRPRALEVAPEYSPVHLGNALVGGLIGMKVDEASGAAYQLEPNPAHATLIPLSDTPPFPWQLRIEMPEDLREEKQRVTLETLVETCDETSPFGDQTAFAVQQRLRGKLVNSGLFEGVAAGAGAQREASVRVRVLAMCSEVDGAIFLSAVGVTSLHLVMQRNGVIFLEKTYSGAVGDRDDAYTGSQTTTREQLRIRTVLDSLNVALDQFVDDLTVTGKMWSGRTPSH